MSLFADMVDDATAVLPDSFPEPTSVQLLGRVLARLAQIETSCALMLDRVEHTLKRIEAAKRGDT
jgi:hypothetical protein